ncbi:MAG: hypothetical protein PHT69_10710 [Bacteroidales bacterium]|nr:hypothetical protein [Bacteroidales bacterium]
MGLFDFLFKKKSLTLEEADKLNDTFIAKNPIPKDDENSMMRQAAKLMSGQQFEDSIELYTKLAENYPANRGLYQSQIGAAYYFLADYNKAISFYTAALNNGADKGMMDDNIWEATEALFKQTGEKAHLDNYKLLFPEGNYVKKAEKLH